MPASDSAFALRISEFTERFRRSLFGLPAIWVVGLLALSQVTLRVDKRLQDENLPDVLSTTVESGQSLLSAIASGTITAASVVFSLTLVSVQLASSQFSPRTLRNFLGDRFQQMVFGIVLGTFAFSLSVLRQVRGPLSEDGSPVVPHVGIAVATLLALASLFALLGSINRTARGLRVEAVSSDIVDETLATIADRFPRVESVSAAAPNEVPIPVDRDGSAASGAVVTSPTTGWIQQISVTALAESLPVGSTVRLGATVGSYVSAGQVLATITPIPDMNEDRLSDIRNAYSIGDTRTLQSDVAYGILQLEDIALRALSPGINDPNTAIAVIAQMGTVLVDLFDRQLDPSVVELDGRTVERPTELTHGDYLRGALDKVRRAARSEPAVLASVLRMLAVLHDELERRRSADPEPLAAIRREAERVVAEARRGDVLDADRDEVVELAGQLGLVGPPNPSA